MPELHDLKAPPAGPSFREELFERAELADRRAARRWRLVAIAATAAAVAAVSAAGAIAFGTGSSAGARTVDLSRVCSVPIQGGIPVAWVTAHAKVARFNNGKTIHYAAFGGFGTQSGVNLGGVASVKEGVGISGPEWCKPTAPMPLKPSGLKLYDTYTTDELSPGIDDFGVKCFVGAKVRVHLRALVGSNGVPSSAKLALWTGQKKLRPVAYIDWTPTKVKLYLSNNDCSY